MNTIKLYSNLDKSIRPFVVGLLANLAIALLKFGIASLGGSKLVLMDGLFSFMAAAVFLIPWQAQVIEQKPHDEKYPYGLGKVLFISMVVVGFLGLVISAHMLFYSLVVMTGLQMRGLYTLAIMVTIISIITNEVLYRYFKEKSQSSSNTMLVLAGRYNRIGAWISSFVLLFLVLAFLGATYLERAGVAIVSIVVFFVGLRMIFVGFSGIMDKVPSAKILNRIRTCAQKISEVKDIVNIKARHVGTLLHIDMWISIDETVSIAQADRVARNVKLQLMEKIPSAKEVNIIIT
ncbi:cation diffusion facilitator family transporter [Planctomycetota bacterium]